ncbi:hypothetical protein RQP46_003415 [Phenoliferia psychrophenolica]
MSTPPTPPRASLTTLPTEIKAKIVAMAYLQQEAWKERDPKTFKAAFETDDAETRSRWHPLSLVNKEFRELYIPHIFRAIAVVHLDHRPTDAKDPALERAFDLLSLLPGLRELHISFDAADYLFGDFSDDDDSPPKKEQHRLRLANLASFGRRLERLDLEYLRVATTVALLHASPWLRSLKMLIYGLDENDFRCLMDAMASLQNLVDLEIFSEDPLPLTAICDPRHWTPPPIKFLHIGIGCQDISIQFARLFAGTLESLRTWWARHEEGPWTPVGPPLQLPHLRHLTIIDDVLEAEAESQILDVFKESPLLSISYATRHGNPIHSNTALETFLDRQPNLRRINIGARGVADPDGYISRFRMSPSDLTAYANLVRSRGLEADFEDAEHNPFAPKRPIEKHNIEYGKEEIAEEDVAKAARWIGVLGALEGERTLWKD